MVVRARLAWIRRLVAGGSAAQISTSPGAIGGRAKYKFMIFHGRAATSPTVRQVLLAEIDHFVFLMQSFQSVDRGHRHVGAQASEVCIWLSQLPAGGVQGPPGPDGGSGPGSGDRPRRGRSPPGASDPWQGPNNVDPWASSAAPSNSPAKAPRTHGTASWRQTVCATLSWDTWNPSLATSSRSTTVTASSPTPDPPVVRSPRIVPPARTGTPLLSTAEGSDGPFVSSGACFPETVQMTVDTDTASRIHSQDAPWVALTGMAFTACTIAGATIASACTHDEFEGTSLASAANNRREENARTAHNAKMHCDDEKYQYPHVLSDGDVVYLADENSPYVIKRLGYGGYREELRIVRVGEPNSYTAGRWAHHSRLYLLEIGDSLKVVRDVTEAMDTRRVIPADTIVTVTL